MQWLKSAMVVVPGMLLLAAGASSQGCSSNPVKSDGGGSDAIVSPDVKKTNDGSPGTDSGTCPSGLDCEQCDITGYSPTPMAKPVQHTGACTTAQLQAFVTACFSTTATQTTCTAWSAIDGGACTTCLAPVNATAATWGPFFCPTQTSCPANAGGCVDLLTNTTAQEKANNGAGSCGDLITDNFGCQDYACGGCTSTSDFSTCDTSATANECKAKVDLVESSTGPCAPIDVDAAVPADACFPQDDTGNVGFVDVFCGTGTGTPN